MTATLTEAPATVKQVKYLNDLLAARPAYQDIMNLWPEHVARLTKRQASHLITEVKAQPVEADADAFRRLRTERDR